MLDGSGVFPSLEGGSHDGNILKETGSCALDLAKFVFGTSQTDFETLDFAQPTLAPGF
jgi:hypothetical protein